MTTPNAGHRGGHAAAGNNDATSACAASAHAAGDTRQNSARGGRAGAAAACRKYLVGVHSVNLAAACALRNKDDPVMVEACINRIVAIVAEGTQQVVTFLPPETLRQALHPESGGLAGHAKVEHLKWKRDAGFDEMRSLEGSQEPHGIQSLKAKPAASVDSTAEVNGAPVLALKLSDDVASEVIEFEQRNPTNFEAMHEMYIENERKLQKMRQMASSRHKETNVDAILDHTTKAKDNFGALVEGHRKMLAAQGQANENTQRLLEGQSESAPLIREMHALILEERAAREAGEEEKAARKSVPALVRGWMGRES